VGGNLVHYPGKVSTPTANLSTVKLLLNSISSTPGDRFTTFNLKDFYLGTPMARKEYMRIPIASIPKSIIDQYGLTEKAHKGLVLVEISKGMYGIPQAGTLAFNQLKSHLTISPPTTTLHAPTHLVYGTTPHAISIFPLSSTIVALNIKTAMTPFTSSLLSKKFIPSQQIGPASFISP
jgi:hypothetical protein